MKAQEHIFKAIDIRGIYRKDIDEEVMEHVGLAAGAYTKSKEFIVSHDVRISSPSLGTALTKGLNKAGTNVINAGALPIGIAAFYSWKLKKPLAYVTASHAPPEWNGVKFFHENGNIFQEDENRKIRDIFFTEPVEQKSGSTENVGNKKIYEDYKDFITEKIQFSRKMKIAFDFGNGATSFLTGILRSLPIDSVFIYDTPDGTFPNRHSDPGLSDLHELKKAVKNCDMGFAFDGDGDRILIMDDKGRSIPVEYYTIILLENLFRNHAGGVVVNIECSNIVDAFARAHNRLVHRVKVGHTFMINAVEEHKACFGVEKSGHCILPSIAPFHDVLPVALYAASIISRNQKKLSSIIDSMPATFFERETFDCSFEARDKTIKRLQHELSKEYKNTNTLDGVRIDFDDGWVLIRASNTEPIIRLTAEAQTENRLKELKNAFREQIKESIVLFS